MGIAMKMGHDKQTNKTAEHPDAPAELWGKGEGSHATTWRELGLPHTLSRVSEPPTLPAAASRREARQQIYDTLGAAGSERIAITRDDGSQDIIIGRVDTPAGLGDVMLTNRFVRHLINDHPNQAREKFARFILPSLNNPAEVWQQPRRINNRIVDRRIFLTAFEHRNTVAVVQKDQHGFLSWTFFPSRTITDMRKGILLHRRE